MKGMLRFCLGFTLLLFSVSTPFSDDPGVGDFAWPVFLALLGAAQIWWALTAAQSQVRQQ